MEKLINMDFHRFTLLPSNFRIYFILTFMNLQISLKNDVIKFNGRHKHQRKSNGLQFKMSFVLVQKGLRELFSMTKRHIQKRLEEFRLCQPFYNNTLAVLKCKK